MTKVGGTTKRFYKETRGIKVSGGQMVKAGTILTRMGHRWKPGHNIIGLTKLTAACDGTVYFTKKRGHYRRAVTFVHIKPDNSSSKKTEK